MIWDSIIVMSCHFHVNQFFFKLFSVFFAGPPMPPHLSGLPETLAMRWHRCGTWHRPTRACLTTFRRAWSEAAAPQWPNVCCMCCCCAWQCSSCTPGSRLVTKEKSPKWCPARPSSLLMTRVTELILMTGTCLWYLLEGYHAAVPLWCELC